MMQDVGRDDQCDYEIKTLNRNEIHFGITC